MLSYNQLKPGTYIIFNNEPYEILEYDFLRMQQRKPVAQVKMRNLVSGNSMAYTFHQSDKIEEADISYKTIKFLYFSKDNYWFCAENNPKDRFSFLRSQLGKKADFLKSNIIIDAVIFNEKVIDVKIPIKVELKVIEAPPGIKGDTAQGGTKQVKLESGASVNVPLFINQDDVIRVNTQSGLYIERAEKA